MSQPIESREPVVESKEDVEAREKAIKDAQELVAALRGLAGEGEKLISVSTKSEHDREPQIWEITDEGEGGFRMTTEETIRTGPDSHNELIKRAFQLEPGVDSNPCVTFSILYHSEGTLHHRDWSEFAKGGFFGVAGEPQEERPGWPIAQESPAVVSARIKELRGRIKSYSVLTPETRDFTEGKKKKK